MLRTCVAAAAIDGSVCVFLEPIALYHTTDLHEPGDAGWLAPYEPPERWSDTHVPIGSGRTHGDGRDLTIVTSGNGLYLSLRVARRLAAGARGPRRSTCAGCRRCRSTTSCGRRTPPAACWPSTRRGARAAISEGVLSALVDAGFTGRMARVTSKDSIVPLGDAANLVLLSEDEIEAAARRLVGAPTR